MNAPKQWWQTGYYERIGFPPRAQYRAAVDGGQDIFGCYDFVGFDDKGAVVGVQVCRKRPSDIASRKAKIATHCKLYRPAMRAIISYYNKDGFVLEEYLPDEVWRLKALLPYDG